MEYNIPVVVPELGCFTVVNIPSDIRDGRVIPPFKTVRLDSENTIDDSVLKGYIAKKKNISIEQAAEEIRKFYHQNFINKLPSTKNIVFEQFGTFSLNEFNNIIFNPDPDFFKDNYGLDYAYFSGNTVQQPTGASVPPKPEPVPTPKPEPVFTPKSEPVQTPPDPPQPKAEDSLFDTNDTSRFRENTTRNQRPSMFEKKEEPLKPSLKSKTQSIPKKPKQKVKKMKSGSSSNIWILWVLLAAAGLGVFGYYFYPVIYPKFFSPNTTVRTVHSDQDTEPDDKTGTDTLNIDLAQTLDDATDKKNALNLGESRQTETSASRSAQETSAPSSGITQSQANAGKGRYVLIAGSFETYAAAEKFCRKLQAEGLDYEIIAATVKGVTWNRVSVASYDTLAEAVRQADQMRSKPYCQDVWVIKR